MTYAEKLKDPRWQRKRLERMEVSDFSCDECGNTEKTLHVHHGVYKQGADPWDYSDDELHCLCETHHKWMHHVKAEADKWIGRLGVSEMEKLVGFLHGALVVADNEIERVTFRSIAHKAGVANSIGMDLTEFKRLVPGKTVDDKTLFRLMTRSEGHGRDPQPVPELPVRRVKAKGQGTGNGVGKGKAKKKTSGASAPSD